MRAMAVAMPVTDGGARNPGRSRLLLRGSPQSDWQAMPSSADQDIDQVDDRHTASVIERPSASRVETRHTCSSCRLIN
jgi:hypothetical protein